MLEVNETIVTTQQSDSAAQQSEPVAAPREVVSVAKPRREKRKRPHVQFGPPPQEVEHVEHARVRYRAS
jgi:hypothetical protein